MKNVHRPAMRPLLMLLIALACRPPPAAASAAGGFSAEYTGYSHGFTVMKLAGTLKLTESAYTAHVTFHTAGMVGMLVHADNDSQAEGTFAAGQAAPYLFEGSGHLRGTARLTRIVYKDGNPMVQALTPAVEQERTPVPPADTVHTIDTLSAVALLIREVARDGKCEGNVTTFDGRRLATQTVHTTGQESLPKTGRSVFSGQALRCDFDGRQLAGFIRDENEDDLRKPRHGTAWLAAMLPDAPPIPVRVMFENKLLGQVTLYLTAVTALK